VFIVSSRELKYSVVLSIILAVIYFISSNSLSRCCFFFMYARYNNGILLGEGNMGMFFSLPPNGIIPYG